MLKMLAIKVDDAFLGFKSPFFAVDGRGQHGVAFAPHTEVTDVDERHIGIVVVTGR